MNANKRVIFTQGGKGGVGKTTFANDLADWYRTNEIPVKLLDFDVENHNSSGFSYFNSEAEKFDINQKGSLDEIFGLLEDVDYEVVLIDQAAASGKQTFQWFKEVGETANKMGISFTSVGLITGDPGSVESVTRWAGEIGKTADYLIVKNKMENPEEIFAPWNNSAAARKMLKGLNCAEITMDARLAAYESLARDAGLTPAQAAEASEGELSKPRWKIRSIGYAEQAKKILNSVEHLLLPPQSDEAAQ